MKINCHGGHNRHVPGIISYLDEVTEDRKINAEVIKLLRAEGHTVYDCTDGSARTQRGNLNSIVKMCNAHKVDLNVSFHLNGCKKEKKDGKTKGVEVWIYDSSSKAKAAAERVCKNIAKLGFTNRGVKYSKSLAVIRGTNDPAMLVEVCFADDEDDILLYKKIGYKKIAKVIAEGILNRTIKDKTNGEVSKAFKVKAKRKLCVYKKPGAGYTGNKTDISVYTIVETAYKNGMPYGKLKSGAGWIKIHSKYCLRV